MFTAKKPSIYKHFENRGDPNVYRRNLQRWVRKRMVPMCLSDLEACQNKFVWYIEIVWDFLIRSHRKLQSIIIIITAKLQVVLM